ncbi:uncharacterized protein LOC123537283 isoform X2 [Mercenaria mercenaria]|uniref:uncharacterized protein LOC123537283 isoform X2 n=1 Tax=Mercenaria mercenaria TaxID=6596 RepID=UPI00234FAB7A|nr:uncharacterized protein LOC123537283 isoform X2 [Mercenaria mercenaria]
MSDYTSKLTNKNFHYWIKGNVALNLAKEGIGHIINNRIETFHTVILQEVLGSQNGNLCNECQTENVLPCPTSGVCTGRPGSCSYHCTKEKMFRPCPKNQCDKIKEKIRKSHRFNKPSWKNTRAELWGIYSWEIAKCYMPPDGYLMVTTIGETDLNGILGIIANHVGFKTLFDENTREELKLDELTISMNDITQVITDVIKVNTEKSLQDIRTALKEHEQTTGDTIEDILKTTASQIKRKATEDIENAAKRVKHETVSHIDEAQTEAVVNIKVVANAAVADIKLQHAKALESRSAEYNQLKNDLLDDLITYYEHEHGAIPVSPLVPENDTPLLQFYVPARMIKVEPSVTDQGMKCVIRKPVDSFHDIFKNGRNLCHNIYISAQAGIGKTTFSKRLCMVWCNAKTSLSDSFKDKNILHSEIEMLRTFDFVFFILLREVSGKKCHIDDMIIDHLVPQLAGSHVYTQEFVKEVLRRETCLIIIDGLDEWSNPPSSEFRSFTSVPQRIVRKTCVILTTTRPWKMHEARISKSKIDKEIEMIELDRTSTDQLVRNVVFALPDIPDQDRLVNDICTRIANKTFEDIMATPVLLIQLICLWHDGRTAGESKCQMYCNIIEFILHRGVEKIQELGKQSLLQGLQLKKVEYTDYPVCFSMNEYCRSHFSFLMNVGKLAFMTLVNENKESRLVLHTDTVQKFLSDDELQCCLEMGLLTKSKRRSVSVSAFTVSFIHKGFQEFFCALYMLSSSEEANILDVVSELCNSVRKILDLSNVFIFLSGLIPHKLSTLSKRLCDSVAHDSLIKEYRCELCVFNKLDDRNKPLKELQDMYVACVQESEYNAGGGINICQEDFVYDIDCKKDNYLKGFRTLLSQNIDRIKSIFINTEGTYIKLRQLIDEFHLSKTRSLEKLSVVSEVEKHDFDDILSGSLQSLKALSIKCVRWLGNTWTFECVTLSESSIMTLQNMPLLECFALECVNVTHKQLGSLLEYISDTKSLKQIAIGKLNCIDHSNSCEGFDLDLSGHVDLSFLEFGSLSLKSFKLNVLSLENCAIGRLKANILTSLLESLSKATKLRQFSCLNFTALDDVTEKVLQTLYLLHNLHGIYLQQVDLGDRTINLSAEMKNIECIHLNRVKMTTSLVTKLVDFVQTLQHSVAIILRNCEIKEEADYKKLKENIYSSDKFVVSYDGLTELNYHLFSFKSVV